eukprot:TRINITY_DN24901_c0_g1_i1.p1 TRINITY_DN24901_c0_g1~~TRINITY_DN24901_c0_g1_i1.p1  ORF type:complete len:140 (-),score=29.96 TRINITY_DN24901_c0_g1_i1:294-713(-)
MAQQQSTATKAQAARSLYVGGLSEEVTEKILHAAFIPFGEIAQLQIPQDQASGTNKGFGFVEFEEVEDAQAAIENMNGAELFGRVLKVNKSRPLVGGTNKAIWEDADAWYQKNLAENPEDVTFQLAKADMTPAAAQASS